MKYWICTYTSTNDQGLGVGVVTKSEEEPRIEWENVEWKEISEDDYNNCLDPVNGSRFINQILDIPHYIITDIMGKVVYEGSYMACEWYKEKGGDVRTFGGNIVLRKTHIENIAKKSMKSVWWNTIQRIIEIEGGKLNSNNIKFVDRIITDKLVPYKHQLSQDKAVLRSFFKTKFITFNDIDTPVENRQIVYDLGEFIRFRLTFGDRPINHEAVVEININLL